MRGFVVPGLLAALVQVPAVADRSRSEVAPTDDRYLLALLFQTNRARATHRVRPVEMSEELRLAAQAHAEDMLARDYFAHASPEGDEIPARMKARSPRTIVLGLRENLMRSEGEDPTDRTRRARKTVDGWLDSRGHRENLLSPEPSHVGFGVSSTMKKDRLVEYVVQVMGSVVGRWTEDPRPVLHPPESWRASLLAPLDFFLEDALRPGRTYPDPRRAHVTWEGGSPLLVTTQGRVSSVQFPRLEPGEYRLMARKRGADGYHSLRSLVVR